MITVEMSAPYLSMGHLVQAIGAAVAKAKRNGEELVNPEEVAAAASVEWEGRLRMLAHQRTIKGHDWDTLASEDWANLDIERDVFFVDDLNACRDLTDVGFHFVVVENERERLEFESGYAETVHNDTIINWRYWVDQMPTLSAGEASRLMSALDPDLYADLSARPVPKNRVDDVCKKAASLERLAVAEGKERDTPAGWLKWAKDRAFRVHAAYEMAATDKGIYERAAAALKELPGREAVAWSNGQEFKDGRRMVTHKWAGLESSVSCTLPDFIEEVTDRLNRWREGSYAIIEAAQVLADTVPLQLNASSLCKQMEAAIHAGALKLRKNGIPMPVDDIPAGRLWNRFVLEKDVNEWLQAIDAGYFLAHPYKDPSLSPDGIRYELLMFARLEAKTEWAGGRMAPSDILPLHEAAKLATKHAGHEVTMNDFLRAGARGEIRIRAVCPRTVTMLPVRQGDVVKRMDAGSYPDLPADACEILSITGRANWRIYEYWEPREEFGGSLCRFTRWKLPDTEPDLVTTPTECLVMGWDVHALADAFRGDDAAAPDESSATVAPASEAAAFDIRLHATRDELIEAFGSFTGMKKDWFTNLKDTPALMKARKSPGQGGRGHIMEPFFCPFEVMQWLVSTKRKKGRPMSEHKGWEMLEKFFPRVYAQYAAADPRE